MQADPIANQIQRCAIYTRKSIELGLKKEFNSLETQRAICSAYITSQVHRGWREIPKHYDDAGQSGATLERPQLRELLDDIERGNVDTIVVYKLDRITRTLLDFVRLMDVFERYDVSFVSITQSFDTSDSMGRLILNVLLTFAQFEREISADRLRDKRRLMTQSGRWMGGVAPLGYSIRKGILRVNPNEAQAVQFIFDQFVQLGTFESVSRECERKNIRTRRYKSKTGQWVGGGSICTATICYILGNPAYIGMLRLGEELVSGLHDPIIDKDLWGRAQELRQKRIGQRHARIAKFDLLSGILFDCYGRSMTVRCSIGRNGRRNYYYASNPKRCPTPTSPKCLRVRADEFEKLVCDFLKVLLSDREVVRSGLLQLGCYDGRLELLTDRTEDAVARLDQLGPRILKIVVQAIFSRLELSRDGLKVVVDWRSVERFLDWDTIGSLEFAADGPRRFVSAQLLEVPGCVAQRSNVSIPVDPREDCQTMPDAGLARLIKDARRAQALLDGSRTETLPEIAKKMRVRSSHFDRLVRLNYLAPDVIAAILDGTQPSDLTADKLVRCLLPLEWNLQRRVLGFPPRPEGN